MLHPWRCALPTLQPLVHEEVSGLTHSTDVQEPNATTTDELFELQQAKEEDELRQQQAQLATFAGMRAVGSTDEETAQDPEATERPHIVTLFRSQPALVESAEQLAGAGGDALKAELDRLGLKCGGTVQMRAERLFQTRNKPRSEWPKAIFAKRKGAGGDNRDAKRAQRGPMLPGQIRKAGAMRVPGVAEHRRDRPVGRPRGQGAGATEQVGIYRPNT